jgi:hypothetical protein
MRVTQAYITDLTRRRLNPAVFTAGLPITVCDQQGNIIGKFSSPRKFGKALASAELILMAGDKIHISGFSADCSGRRPT